MRHYIEGEFTLEELKVTSFMELQETSDRFKDCTIEYETDWVTLFVRCDSEGSCAISKLGSVHPTSTAIEVGDLVEVNSNLGYYCDYSGKNVYVQSISDGIAWLKEDSDDFYGQLANLRDLTLIKKA